MKKKPVWTPTLLTLAISALSMPMDITDSYESELDASQSVIFYCTHGGSSMKLARYLGNRGFDTATVIGGYNAMCGYQKKLQKYG